MSLAFHKQKSQRQSCIKVIETVLWKVLAEQRPADRILSTIFRENRQFGSRDRRVISETLYAILRWWGWLGVLLPKQFTVQLQSADAKELNVAPLEWQRLFVAARLLEDGCMPGLFTEWANDCGLEQAELVEFTKIKSALERLQRLAKNWVGIWDMNDQMVNKLIPQWTYSLLDDKVDCERLIEKLQSRPPIWLRFQTKDHAKVIAEFAKNNVDLKQHELMKNSYCIRQTPIKVNLRSLQSFRDGDFEIQDLASQVIGAACQAKSGERWWDACAGAGGKTLQLAEMMDRRGSVTATDIRTYKLKDLKKRARRAQFPNIRCREWRGKAVPKKWQNFHGVLVDAPCSCSGTWRRNPDARWTTTPDDVVEIVKLQMQLLENASQGVLDGGVLVYGTCSMFGCENVIVVNDFLAKHPEFSLEPFTDPITGKKCNGMLQTWHWHGDCDAMFAARFRKVDK